MSKSNRNKGAKAPAPTQTTPSVVVNQITIKQPTRKVWDVGAWRSALKNADSGKVRALYDLYEDILIDGVLADAIDKRIRAVSNTPLTFVDENGEEVEEVTALMDSLDWEEVITQIMMSRFWGRSACELGFTPDGLMTCAPIPAKHINLRNKTILINQDDQSGIPYEDDPFLVVLGKDRDFGLLLKAAPYIIYKRGGYGDWAQWIELFGMPRRVGKYSIHDPESRKVLEQAMEAAGSAPYVIAPEGTTIEHVETSSGNGVAYNDFRRACNEEVLITILGQTMTTVQGDKGARSLGEVHLEVEQNKHKGDLRYVQRVLNQYLKPRLEARGYPVQDGRFIFPESAEHLEVTDIVQLSDIIEIPTKWLHDKYAIPMAEDGEEIARRQPAMPMLPDYGMIEEEEEEGKQDSPQDKPVRNADGFFRRVMRFFGLAPRHALGACTTTLPTWSTEQISLADAASISERIIEAIKTSEGTRRFAPELFAWLSNDLITALDRGYKGRIRNSDTSLSVQYQLQDDAYITAMEANLFRFSAGKTLSEVYELNKAFRESKSYADFASRAKEITTTYNDKWRRVEYNTALNCAEAASNYRELKRKQQLFPYWQYKTVGDNKVRDEHRDLDGVILPATDALWDEIYPPNGWGCRCSIVPRLKVEGDAVDHKDMQQRAREYQASPDWQSAKAQGWGVNKAEIAEVFTANQQYIHKMPGKSSRKIMELGHTDFGLDSIAKEIQKEKRPEIPTFQGDKHEWFDRHQIITDYQGRKISFDKAVFDRHTSKGYEKTRVPLLECIPDALSSPDEVWLNDYQGKVNNINFIKYYQGRCINVVCELRDGKIYQVDTWFEIRLQYKNNLPQEVIAEEGKKAARGKRDPKYKYRRGLLIYNKAN